MEYLIIIGMLIIAIVIAICALNPNAKAKLEAAAKSEEAKIKAFFDGLTSHTSAVVAALAPPTPAPITPIASPGPAPTPMPAQNTVTITGTLAPALHPTDNIIPAGCTPFGPTAAPTGYMDAQGHPFYFPAASA